VHNSFNKTRTISPWRRLPQRLSPSGENLPEVIPVGRLGSGGELVPVFKFKNVATTLRGDYLLGIFYRSNPRGNISSWYIPESFESCALEAGGQGAHFRYAFSCNVQYIRCIYVVAFTLHGCFAAPFVVSL